MTEDEGYAGERGGRPVRVRLRSRLAGCQPPARGRTDMHSAGRAGGIHVMWLRENELIQRAVRTQELRPPRWGLLPVWSRGHSIHTGPLS